jgi:hypothetical protein
LGRQVVEQTVNSRGLLFAAWVVVILLAFVTVGAFSQSVGLLVGVTGGFALRMWGQQRAGRVAVAITAVAVVLAPVIVSAAALTGVTAVLATAAVGGTIGFVLDRTLVQPIIYPRFGLGN